MKILFVDRLFDHPFDKSAGVTLFTDSSVSRNHRPLFLPPFADKWVMKTGLALRVSRLGKFIGERFVSRYYDAVAPVVRLVPLDADGKPGSATLTSFDSSIVIGDWIPLADLSLADGVKLSVNSGDQVTVTAAGLDIDRVVSSLSGYFTMKMGDVVIPGTIGTEVTPVIDSRLSVTLDGIQSLDIRIK